MNRILVWLQRRWRLLAGLVALALAYVLAGFYLVPQVARSQLDRLVRDQLHRQIDIGAIAFNPFTLTARIDGLDLREADGAAIARFDSLVVDAQISSLWNRAITLKMVRLDGPAINVIVNRDGSLNLANLAPPANTPAPVDKPAARGLPAIRIDSLLIDGGRVDFTDDSRPRAYKATVESIHIALTDFRTVPGHGNALQFSASTPDHEHLDWSGDFSLQPIASKGQIKLSQLKLTTVTSWLQDKLPLDLSAGTLDLGLNYDFRFTTPLQLTLDLPAIKLADLVLAPRTAPATSPWIRIPSVTIDDTRVSLADRAVSVGAVRIAGTRVAAWRDVTGAINLQHLVSAPAPAKAADTAASAQAWKLKVGPVDLSDAAVDFEDRAVTPAVKFHLAPLKVTIDGVSSDAAAKLGIAADITINQKAHLHADTDLQLQPLAANVKFALKDFDLPTLQPYVSQATSMALLSGRVGSKAVIGYDSHPAKGQPQLHFAGDVEVDNLVTQDTGFHQDFVKWQALKVTGIDFRKAPDSLAIDRIEALKPYGRVIIQPDQTLNVTHILHPPQAGHGTAASTPPPPTTAQAASRPVAATAQSAPPMPIRIGAIVFSDGSAFFADHSIQPSFATGIQQLNGSVKGLSSDPGSRADVSIAGQVDRYSPVSITGQINPLATTTYTDLALSFRNMELTTFNPYSGKFAGYNIAKGKLTTELRYHIENRKLDAQHHIIVDQLEFGPATESKQAVSLPIKLAVALLKDRNGVIDLNLPVSGSLDDPQFRIMPIVWKVLLNTLTKAVTAPFALLGSLFGGGPELQFVDFAPGSFLLAPEQNDKLQKLAHSLAERPQLKLDIPLNGTGDADTAPLAHAALDKAVDALNPPKPGASTDAVQKQRLDTLASLYQKQSGQKPVYPAVKGSAAEVRTAQVSWLEQALLAAYTPDANQLLRLGRKRADAVQAALLSGNAVAADRLFLVSTPQSLDASKPSPADVVRLEMKLE